MRIKFLLFFVILFYTAGNLFAQSLYYFQFKSVNPADTSSYDAFLIKYMDGTGVVRIKQPGTNTRAGAIVESQISEHFVTDSGSETGNSITNYAALNFRFISGNSSIKPQPLRFWFKLNEGTGFLEPWAVSESNTTVIPTENNFLVSELIQSDEIKKEFVLQYFLKSEDIYKKLFESTARGLSPAEKKIKIHLLAIGNTEEETIGASCLNDVNRIVQSFTDLAEFLGITINTKTIIGETYNKKNVETSIKQLRPGPDDIVIFYYSGHGFRKTTDRRRYPYIDLRGKDQRNYMLNSMNIEDIFESIKKRGARLNLVISDCCNTEVTATNGIGTPVLKTKGSVDWSENNCRVLFLNKNRMSILMTAADRDEKATSNNNFGGFFSYFFSASLENHFSRLKKDVSWTKVLIEAKNATLKKASRTYCEKPYIPANICRQTPFYTIKLSSSQSP